jgi:hypothetical protein
MNERKQPDQDDHRQADEADAPLGKQLPAGKPLAAEVIPARGGGHGG